MADKQQVDNKQTGNSQQPGTNDWQQIVTSLYPDALTRTYCVPPVQFNRVPYVRDTVPGTGQAVLVLPPPCGAAPVHTAPPASRGQLPSIPRSLWSQEAQPHLPPLTVQESDLRDDFAQNHVLLNLQALGDSRQEAMFIMSQLHFTRYLDQPAYAAAAARLPRPASLAPAYRHGDFDFLLIHRQHGILIGELKSVGKAAGASHRTLPPTDTDVAKRVKQAVKQLDKSERVVRHLVSDIGPGMTVKKTLFLPYVSSAQLQRVLDNDQQLEQAVCQSLGAADTVEAVQLCCCSDQLSQPASYWHVTPAVLSQLSTWWTHRVARTVDTLLTDQLYLDIVARFVGPATSVSVSCHSGVRVEVRTAGQALAELGRRLAWLVLTLQQLDLMNRDPPLVCITGPPGTGKTVVLVLEGLRWLRQGHDVEIVSTMYDSRAANKMMTEQINMSLRAGPTPSPAPGTLTYHRYNFYTSEDDVEQAVRDLLQHVNNGHLYVLIDEVRFDSRNKAGPRHTLLVTRLVETVPHLHLWVAGVEHSDIPPALQTQVFTVPLRSAPSVLREIQPVIHRFAVHDYSDRPVPAPGDGLQVITMTHHGNGHTGRWPVDCRQCGQDIAARLRRLGVGSSAANSPVPLSYRDVFILTRSSELQDDVRDDAGQVTSPASGVVQGLRGAGLPVSVLWDHGDDTRWEREMEDVAVAARDAVTVAWYGMVSGLERRVVVVLQGRNQDLDEGDTDDVLDVTDRLGAASRCTTQLIRVTLPPSTTATTTTTSTTTTTTTTTPPPPPPSSS